MIVVTVKAVEILRTVNLLSRDSRLKMDIFVEIEQIGKEDGGCGLIDILALLYK